MRRKIAAVLVLLLVLSLCACKSKEVKNAEALIAAIGEVSLESGDAIAAAQSAYDALSGEDKADVENSADLTAALDAYQVIYDAAKAEQLIAAIGEVTLDSEAAITAAEEAYAALSGESKALVTNAADLTAARNAYEEAAKAAAYQEAYLSLVGTWYNEMMGNDIWPNGLEDTDCEPRTVSGYGVTANGLSLMEDGTFAIEDVTGTWSLSEDLTTVTLTLEDLTASLEVTQEDGFTKLLGELFKNKFFAYVKEEDYQAAFDAKYVAVALTSDNFRDYIGESTYVGTTTTNNGLMYCYFYPSQAYDDGLVYLGCNCQLVEYATYTNGSSITINAQFPVMTGSYDQIASASWSGSASGYMFYLKADHVAANYISEDGYRTLELTNGVTMTFNGYWEYYDLFWTYVDADYAENIY